MTADCLPVALIAPEGVAMIHAGWRGLPTDVLKKGVEALREAGATRRPGRDRAEHRRLLLRGQHVGAPRVHALPARRRAAEQPRAPEERRAPAAAVGGHPARARPRRRHLHDVRAAQPLSFAPPRLRRRSARHRPSGERRLARHRHGGDWPIRQRPDGRARAREPRRGARADRGGGGARRARRAATWSSSRPSSTSPLDDLAALAEAGVDDRRLQPGAGPAGQGRRSTATRSRGTSSATCRAARSSRSPRSCG